MFANRVGRILLVSVASALMLSSASPSAQAVGAPLPAQTSAPDRDWNDDIPAHLSVVDGEVTLERDGRLEPAEANLPLLAGDRLRTRGGRVEILFADGSTLALDEHTELDLMSDSLSRLLVGRLRIAIPRTTADLEYRVDAPAASVWINVAGEYRVEAGRDRRGEPSVDLTVFRGSAELANDYGRTLVRAGAHAVATADAEPSQPYAVNSAALDEFDEWVEDQRDVRYGTGTSAAYLPQEVRYYSGAFDTYGTWDYLPSYGQVWYPRVSVGWRPYWQGRWSFTAHFGWIWIGIDRWSWPTHHYGRWGISSGRWYWIPDRRWAPAWVYWASAPGYVGWCPLGFDGRPVIGFRSYNAFYEPWLAWTVIPSRHFTHNTWVTQHALAQTAITPSLRGGFVERASAPVVSGPAVPRRELAPLRAPTLSRVTTAARTRGGSADGPFDGARAATGGARTGAGGAAATTGGARVSPDRGRTGADAGRPANDAGRTTSRIVGGAEARGGQTRGAVAPPARTDESRASQTGRQADVGRTAPPTTRGARPSSDAGGRAPLIEIPRAEPRGGGSRTDESRASQSGRPADVGRTAPPSRDARPSPSVGARAPQIDMPRTDPGRSGSRAEPNRGGSRVAPRQDPPPQVAPPPGGDSGRMRSRPPEPERYVPPPAPPDTSRNRGRTIERNAPPPPPPPDTSRDRGRAPERYSPPPPSPPPSAAPSRRAPEARQPAGPPPSSAAPPPSRNRGGGPPAAQPPPSGGGDQGGRAAPRRGGGRGGGG